MARPTAMTEAAQRKYLEAIRKGNYREVASAYAGVTSRTVQTFFKKKEGAAFLRKVLEAEKKVEITLVGTIYQAATNGDLDTAKWYLARKFPERWGNNTELLRNLAKLLKSLEEERAKYRPPADASGAAGS